MPISRQIPGLTALEEYLSQQFDNFKRNRSKHEEKWQRNRNAFAGDFVASGRKTGEGEDWRSTTTINGSKSKAMSAYAILLDTLMIGGKLPFATNLDRTMIAPEEAEAYEKLAHDVGERIHSQIEAGRTEREFMRGLLSLPVYGEGWLKLKIDAIQRRTYRDLTGVQGAPMQLRRFMPEYEEQQIPSIDFVPVWNMFCDVEASDVADMTGLFQRDWVCAYDLRKYIGLPGFDTAQIERVIKEADQPGAAGAEGLDNTTAPPRMRDVAYRTRTIERREWWGRVPRRFLEEFEASRIEDELGDEAILNTPMDEQPHDGDEVEVLAVVANGRIIRLVRTQLSDRPFLRCKAEEDIDTAYGLGVIDNAAQTQRMLNWAIRAFEDDKRITGNAAFAMRSGLFKGKMPAWVPGTNIEVTEDCDDINKAIMPIVFPDVGNSLMPVLELAIRLMDDDTMIPKVSQGLADRNANDSTAFEVGVREEKAQKYMGSIVRNVDEHWVEPMINWYLDYNISDPAFDMLGPWVVNATGFTSFQNRVARLQKLQQLLTTILADEELKSMFRMDEIGRELARMLDMDPEQFVRPATELANQQPDPMAELQMQETQAKIGKMSAETGRAQADQQRLIADTKLKEAQTLQAEREAAQPLEPVGRGAGERGRAKADATPWDMIAGGRAA